MRLRHIAKNIKDQNWLAVVLDFFIVVSGVFIGIQLGNWNDGRQVKQALIEAENRLQAEHTANLEAIDRFLSDVDLRLGAAQTAITTLQDCAVDAAAQNDVTIGVNAIRGTPGLTLRRTSLSAITGNDDFLSLLSPDRREAIKEFERNLIQTQDTLDWLEDRPFEKHIEDQDHLTFGPPVNLPGSETLHIRPIQLDAPLDIICQDKDLLGAFYLWERTATFQSFRAGQIRDRVTALSEQKPDN